MRVVIRLLAVLECLFGVLLLVVGLAMPFDETTHAGRDYRFAAVGALIAAVAAGWFLYIPIRFFRKPTTAHAVAVGQPAAVLLGIAVTVIQGFGFAHRFDEVPPWLPLAIIAVCLGIPYATYTFVLKPCAYCAFPDELDENEEEEDRSGDPPDDADRLTPCSLIFTPSDEFLRRFTLRLLLLALPLGLLAVGAGIFAGLGPSPDWSSIGWPVAFAAGILVVSMAISFRCQIRIHRRLRFELTDDGIVRDLPGVPRMLIRYDEITRLVDVSGRGLLVVGAGKSDRMVLPRHLDGFDTLRERLAAVRPIVPGKASHRIYLGIAAAVLGILVSMVGAFRGTSPVWVTVCGLVVIGGLCVSVVLILRHPYVDRRIRRGIWGAAVVILVMMIRIWLAWDHSGMAVLEP